MSDTLQRGLSDQETIDSFQSFFDEVKTQGKWLGALFVLDENGKVQLKRVTNNWPNAKIEEAVNLLRLDLEREVQVDKILPINEPLPLAPHLRIDGEKLPADEITADELPKQIRPEGEGFHSILPTPSPYQSSIQKKYAEDDGPNYEIEDVDEDWNRLKPLEVDPENKVREQYLNRYEEDTPLEDDQCDE